MKEEVRWLLHNLEAAAMAVEHFEAVRRCLVFSLRRTEYFEEMSASFLKALRRLGLRPLEVRGCQSRR